jgi:biotin transport system substrate-specific component
MASALLIEILGKVKSSKLFWITSFTLLTAIAAQFTIPVQPVPFTLQSVFVILSGAFLGARNGAISQTFYLILGIIGLPVFAHIPDGTIGMNRLISPTGGYLLCFPIAAFVMGTLIAFSKKYFFVVFAMFISNFLIVFGGAIYLDLFFIHDFSETLKVGVLIFSIWSLVKIFIASSIFCLVNNHFTERIPLKFYAD